MSSGSTQLRLPEFIGVGPARTGTTWLNEAPLEVAGLPEGVKETRFFGERYPREQNAEIRGSAGQKRSVHADFSIRGRGGATKRVRQRRLSIQPARSCPVPFRSHRRGQSQGILCDTTRRAGDLGSDRKASRIQPGWPLAELDRPPAAHLQAHCRPDTDRGRIHRRRQLVNFILAHPLVDLQMLFGDLGPREMLLGKSAALVPNLISPACFGPVIVDEAHHRFAVVGCSHRV